MKALSIVLASSLFLHVVAYDKYSDLYDAIDSEKYQYTSRSDRGIFSNALEGNEPFARIELSAKAMIFDIL